MMKNGLNKELRSVPGGICAPAGFCANAIIAGIDEGATQTDFALLTAEKRCVAAGVFPEVDCLGTTALLSKKRLKFECAQAVVMNGGKANVFFKNGERIADEICMLVEKHTGISEEDVLVMSVGSVGKPLVAQPFQAGIQGLVEGLGREPKNGTLVAQTLSDDGNAHQLSYQFDLWGFSCKIGAVFTYCGKRNKSGAFQVLLTTDASISPKALQRILHTEWKDTLGLLDIDGICTPNDSVLMLASGQAGNYKIDRMDAEYKKFSRILRLVLTEICMRILADCGDRPLFCKVSGAKSKQTARKIAKNLVAQTAIKTFLCTPSQGVEKLLFSVWNAAKTDLSRASVIFKSEKGKISLLEDGEPLPCSKKVMDKVLNAMEYELLFDLGEGNFCATSFGVLFEGENQTEGKN